MGLIAYRDRGMSTSPESSIYLATLTPCTPSSWTFRPAVAVTGPESVNQALYEGRQSHHLEQTRQYLQSGLSGRRRTTTYGLSKRRAVSANPSDGEA